MSQLFTNLERSIKGVNLQWRESLKSHIHTRSDLLETNLSPYESAHSVET